MIELLMQMIPEWIAKSGSPMSEGRRRAWEKMRARGPLFYMMLWAIGMGGLLFILDLGWDSFFEHTKIDPLFATLYAAACIVIALIVGGVNWNVNESRFRIADKSEPAAPVHS